MARNLKTGDLVEVKVGCESTDKEWFMGDMKLYEGEQFEVSYAHGNNLYELRDISKGQKLLDVNDWSFDGQWLKKVKPAVKKTSDGTGASIAPIAKPKAERQFAMIKSGTGCTLILDGATYNLQSVK